MKGLLVPDYEASLEGEDQTMYSFIILGVHVGFMCLCLCVCKLQWSRGLSTNWPQCIIGILWKCM